MHQNRFYIHLEIKKILEGFPRTPLTRGGNPSRALPHSCLRHSATGFQWPFHFSKPDDGPDYEGPPPLIFTFIGVYFLRTSKEKQKVILQICSMTEQSVEMRTVTSKIGKLLYGFHSHDSVSLFILVLKKLLL